MTAKEYIKILLAKEAITMTELIKFANEKSSKKFTIDGISHKMGKGTLRFEEFEYFASLLGYEIELRKVKSLLEV